MPTASQHNFRKLALVAAVLATLPTALAQQSRPEAVLPPPSLYDEMMPAERAAGPAPAPAAQAAPQPRPAAAPAPKAAAPAPAKQAAQPSQPWYKSMFSWMRGGEAKPAQTKMMAAPTASAAADSSGGSRSEYAYYEANKVVRGAYGQCVRTGWWRGSPSDPCGSSEAMAKAPAPKPTTVAAAAPVPVTRPEPVEVQPLAPAPVREERALEPEPIAAAPPAAPAPAPVPAAAPVETMSLSADALFALSSATLKPSARERLDELAAKMMTMDYETIRVVGHTDPTGAPELNDRLSVKRADAVKRYLVAKGVDPKKIVTEGMGSAMPMVTEQDCASLPRARKIACYQPDRRVEIEVLGAPMRTGAAAQPSVARSQ